MFYQFNPDTDWETCSVVSDRALKGGSSHGNSYSWERRTLLMHPHSSQAIAVIAGEIHARLLSRREDGDRNLMPADRSNIHRCFNQNHFSSNISWERETRGFPRYWEMVRPTQYNAATSTNKHKSLNQPPPPTFNINNTLQAGKGGGEKPRRCQQAMVPHCYQAFPSKPLLKFPSNSPAHGPLSRWALSLMACQQQLAPCLLKTKMTD